MKLLILGAGAVGGYLGAHLARAGRDVTFLVRERRAAQLKQRGLFVASPLGDVRTEVAAVTNAASLQPDVVLLACKAYDLGSALGAIAPAVGASTVIVPLLNGIAHLDIVAARFRSATVWGGLVHLGVTLGPHGDIRHLNRLSILQFGPRGGASDSRSHELARLFAGTPVAADARESIEQDLWNKFVFLTTLAGATCLMRCDVGTVMATPDGERLIQRLLEEATAIATAEGFAPDPSQLETYRQQLTQAGSSSKASMLRDVERGSRTECEHVLGDMLARSRRHGLKAPVLEIATTHVRAYEIAWAQSQQLTARGGPT
ncbi:MAG: ketopantoate reductase family protein [Hyphomicrobiaceae bacterium]|nr:MAG: ketopantoate reductase family protein [Hyphomicrobiaceae bacterium]